MKSLGNDNGGVIVPGLKIPSPPSTQPIISIIFLSTTSSTSVNTGATSYVYLRKIRYSQRYSICTISHFGLTHLQVWLTVHYNELCDSLTGLEGLYDEACHHGIGLHSCIQLVEETRMSYWDDGEVYKVYKRWVQYFIFFCKMRWVWIISCLRESRGLAPVQISMTEAVVILEVFFVISVETNSNIPKQSINQILKKKMESVVVAFLK